MPSPPALGSEALPAERQAERVGRGRRAAPGGPRREPLERRGAGELPMGPAMVILLHPGLRGLVEEGEPQGGDVPEQLDQASLQLGPEDLLLPVLIRRIRQRRLVHDAEPGEALPGLGRQHRGAVVGEQRPGESPLEQGLREPVHQALRRLGEIALQVTAEPRAVIEDRQHHRGVPAARRIQHLHPGLVEVEMPEPVDRAGREAAHLAASRRSRARCCPAVGWAGPFRRTQPCSCMRRRTVW